MNTQIRYAAYSVMGLSIVLTLLLVYPEVSRSRAKARAVVPAADLEAGTTTVEGGSATLSPANLKIWEHYYDIPENHKDTSCGHHPEDIPGSIVAGYKESSGCGSGHHTVYRGTVWFDLSTIISKAPPLHVAVKSAKLHFNQSGV